MVDRCRICTSNDLDGLADEIAEQMWIYAARGTADDVPFEKAGAHWEITFRQYARAFIDVVWSSHG